MPPDFFHSRHSIHVEILYPDHLIEAKTSVSAADAAGFHTAVGSFTDTEAGNHIVHHDGAGMDAPREALAAPRVTGPHARRKAVFGVVREAHGFVVVGARHYGKHRPKRFFPHDAHVVRHVGQHGGSVEIWTQLWQPRSACENPCAARFCVFHVRFHDSDLALLNHGTDIGMHIHSISNPQLLCLLRTGP